VSDHPIVEFLRDRYAEFETMAHFAKWAQDGPKYADPEFVIESMWHMRAMVEYLALKMAPASGLIDEHLAGHVLFAEAEALTFLRHMAAPFASHPEYRKEWTT
jgi:Family of unknown function (DUF6221)